MVKIYYLFLGLTLSLSVRQIFEQAVPGYDFVEAFKEWNTAQFSQMVSVASNFLTTKLPAELAYWQSSQGLFPCMTVSNAEGVNLVVTHSCGRLWHSCCSFPSAQFASTAGGNCTKDRDGYKIH